MTGQRDTDDDLLWGYFFTDTDASRLRSLVPLLEAEGYRFVDIIQAEVDEEDPPYFYFHVEKVESHTVESLYQRNQQLYASADEHGLDSYDGMDVGRPDGEPFGD